LASIQIRRRELQAPARTKQADDGALAYTGGRLDPAGGRRRCGDSAADLELQAIADVAVCATGFAFGR